MDGMTSIEGEWEPDKGTMRSMRLGGKCSKGTVKKRR